MKFHTVRRLLLTSILLLPACASAQSAPASNSQPPAASAAIVYHNTQYGFCFALPASWKGYKIVAGQWNGTVLSSSQQISGPQLLIRNPQWTAENPYQDIPIMVFTLSQWKSAESDDLAVSAAPIGPAELGRNSNYVFALPPRWIGFVENAGMDEVQSWMSENQLEAPCGHKSTKPVQNLP